MTASKEEIFSVLKEKWYTQEFNAVPLLITECGRSMLHLKPVIGDEFPAWWGWMKEEYCAVTYHHESLHRIGKLLFDKIRSEAEFLKNVKTEYEKDYKEAAAWTEGFDWDRLKDLDDADLIKSMRRAIDTLYLSVGKSHIIEPFALSTEKHIRLKLAEKVKDDLNRAFTILTSPSQKSFARESDERLHEISALDGDERKKAIEQYIKDFFWLMNSYVKRAELTEELVEEQIKTLSPPKEYKDKKKGLIEKYNLDDELMMLLDSLASITAWQDERKKRIMTCIDYLDMHAEELARRLDIPAELVRYLVPDEIDESITEKKGLREMLEERRKGMIMHVTKDGTDVLTGDDYTEFMSLYRQQEECAERDLHGMTASLGRAVGKVKICKSMEEIKDFTEGYVLVASMTRPEYLPAMKKACAIVTDEGGITCHAAIVSRELGIPCVIGTKNATKVLKDGMTVEVMANHGLVRVI